MTGAIELQPDDGPRSSLSIGPGFRRYSGISPEFARRFAEGIRKLTGNTPGDRRRKTRRLIARMPEAARLAGGQWINRPYPGVRAVEPPSSAGEPPIPGFSGYRFGRHPKKISSGRWCASRRRTREWT
ncbi:hypothetical protein BHE74_00057071 [Ensete ventricosum]|nr:hypothetical protein GW17_00059346 [Ensete ventricosum]RWW37772.1 hypothetical protein BHE74_00057071 [Ensete ventricosum]